MSFNLATLKDTVELVSALVYSVFLPINHRAPRRVVIYYHSLKKRDVAKFGKQMMYLAKHCRVVKASEIMTACSNGANLVTAITFDDAFASIFENAVPVLKKYGLPAAVFVPTGNLGKPPKWALEGDCHDADEIVMNEEQLVELDPWAYEIMSHTVSHPHLTETGDTKLETELGQSKKTLEGIVGHKVIALSYSYGDHNTKVCKAAQKAGYQLGFTIEPSMVDSDTDCLKIGRFSVSPRDSLMKFKLKVSGAYQAAKFLRAIKALVIKCSSVIRFDQWHTK